MFASGVVAIGFAENNWASKSVMHEGRSGLGVAVVDGKTYAIGGASASGFCSFNVQYYAIIWTWTFKAPMPTSRSAFGITVFQNKIYCIGGYYLINNNQGHAGEVNEVYDPASDTWQTKAPMPTPELNIRANVVDGKVYVIGGNNNGTINQVYDPIDDSWTTKASIPTAVNSYASAVVGNKIYVSTSKLTQIYDAKNDCWSLGAPAPSPVILATAGATTGISTPERIYVFGASADLPFWQLTTKGFTTQSYDPKTDSWTVCASMPTGRYDVGIVVVDDLLYVIGGYSTQFSSKGFNPNPTYVYSTLNQQYIPIGYGTFPPQISIISPENKTDTSGNVSLAFTVNKPISWQAYSLDGQEKITIAENTILTELSNGAHNITIYANDTFGNTGVSETISFIVDAPKPFPTVPVAVGSVASVGMAGVGLLVYFRKLKR